MNRLYFAMLLAFAVLSTAQAQWNQSWGERGGMTPGSKESRVQTINPIYTPYMSLFDDFVHDGQAVRTVTWWGTVSKTAQTNKAFMIAFHLDFNNAPDMTGAFYQSVVPSKVIVAGTDGNGNRIYQFTATLKNAFNAKAGLRYWLQVAEIDAKSARKNQPDFFWSFAGGEGTFYEQANSCAGNTLAKVADPSGSQDLAFKLN